MRECSTVMRCDQRTLGLGMPKADADFFAAPVHRTARFAALFGERWTCVDDDACFQPLMRLVLLSRKEKSIFDSVDIRLPAKRMPAFWRWLGCVVALMAFRKMTPDAEFFIHRDHILAQAVMELTI